MPFNLKPKHTMMYIHEIKAEIEKILENNGVRSAYPERLKEELFELIKEVAHDPSWDGMMKEY